MATLEEHGGGAPPRRRLDLLQHLLDGERPRLRVSRLAIEGAELAVGDADVGVIGIGVDDEGDLLLRMQAKAHLLGEATELDEGRVGKEPESVGALQPLTTL